MSSLTLRRAIILALAPATLISQNATAAIGDDLPVVELDPVVVTVSRSATPLSDTPASVTVISAGEIDKNPARNLSDVIQSDAGIYIKQNGGIGQGTNLSIRGTNPSHTLLLKDGVRLNTPNTLTPIYPENLDLTNVDRIEIVKGPASVQYGSDAIGGVVQMVSKKPTRTGAELTGIFGENNTYKAIARGDVVHNGFYASLSGQRLETDGTRIFNTQARNDQAGYEQKGFGAKVGYNNDKVDVGVSFDENKGTNEYSTNSGTSIDAAREFKNTQAKVFASIKATDSIKLSAHYAQAKDEQSYVEPWSTNEYNTRYHETDVNARWNITPQQNILFGITDNTTKYADAYAYKGVKKVGSTGYYLQHQYNNDKFNTQAGIRVEDHDTFGVHTVGQAAARYHFSPSTSVYANIGSAFRAPSLNELYYDSKSTWDATTYLTKGNENLDPEKSISYGLGLDHQINDNLSISLSGFATEVKDLIALDSNFDVDTSTSISTYQNINKAKFTGGELGAKYVRGDYYAQANYSYVETEVKQTGLEIAYRPKHTGTLTLGYDDGVVGVSTSIIARSDAFANSANTIKVPGHATVDVDAHWNINPHVKLFTNIQNIGNVEYKAVYNSANQWYVNGGRQANLGVTFKY
ncbi:TonB-dependent receptor plug domain-containing protein [Moraxella porci]|uniref:TonB-dependent receptor plug domain-containing protein n=1 Tax=Moraxella porci TaxID=1288392 RepID=UPI002449EA6A|nr:TonB-dependent receptor [Moraxella porci]MDH2273526.1 TonB-dependent receptor [Moraxella porci]